MSHALAELRAGRRRTSPRPIPTIIDLDSLPATTVLSTAEVVAVSGFADVTIKLWRKTGRGPRVTMVEGCPRYLVRDVRAWLGLDP